MLQPASFLLQEASFLLQDASFLEQLASFLLQEASEAAPLEALAEAAFLPQLPAPHFLSAGAAANAVEATMEAANAAMVLRFMFSPLRVFESAPDIDTQPLSRERPRIPDNIFQKKM